MPIALALLLAAAVPGSADPVPYQRHVLANGLTVILHEARDVPQVTVYLWYKVGSRDERAGRSGFAHLFEHMMFEGSRNVAAGEYFRSVAEAGGTNNATTSFDRTDYFATVPSERLEEVLRLESDRMASIPVTAEALEKQRPIVFNEINRRENGAYWEVSDRVRASLFPEGHPYRGRVLGSREDLAAATPEDAGDFHRTYYSPNNAVLAVSGDHDSAATLEMVNRWFGGLPAGPTPPAPEFPPDTFEPEVERTTYVDPRATTPLVVLAWRVPGRGRPGWDEMNALAAMLGGGRTSRLVDGLEHRRRLVTGVSAGLMSLQGGDILQIQAVPAPGHTPAEVEAAVRAEIARIGREGPSSAELAGVCRRAEAGAYDAMQSARQIAGLLAESEARAGHPLDFQERRRAVCEMTPARARQAAELYLLPAGRSATVVVLPGAAP